MFISYSLYLVFNHPDPYNLLNIVISEFLQVKAFTIATHKFQCFQALFGRKHKKKYEKYTDKKNKFPVQREYISILFILWKH